MRTALAPLAAPLPASRAQPRRGTDAATGLARLGDRLLDFGVLAFAAWTVAYHFCLGLRLEARWALIGAGAALVPCALVAARSPAVAAAAAVALPHRPRSGSPGRTVLAVTVAAGLGAAVLFAFSEAPWPVTSASKSSPAFDPRRYWRGPVWVNVNWFFIQGLERSGLQAEAGELRRMTLELVSRSGFYEYYDPRSGEPLGASDFSWSAALTLDLLLRFSA